MKTLLEHIEHARTKPHHIRKRIALSIAAGCSILIALVWLIGSFSLGSFAIGDNTFADSAESSPTVTTPENDNQNIAGAAAAFSNENTPTHIEIIDASTSTAAKNAPEQTTIPF
jgi:hypothetical protein